MKKYIFDFGRNNKLSLAEIISYLKMKGHKFRFDNVSEGGALISISNFDPLKCSSRLGAIKRIGRVISEDMENIKGKKLYRRIDEKLFYDVTAVNKGTDIDKLKEILKKGFKDENLKAMYKDMGPGELIKKNSLEILIFNNYIGKTVAISNPLNFKERDMERPNRDREITTSIRLADILLNFAQVEEGSEVLDPFCGNGTILQEALFFGTDVFGLDIEREKIKESRKNIKWFAHEYNIDGNFNIKVGDAQKVSKYFKEDSISSVVSEPELGPMLKDLPNEQRAKEIIDDLKVLYGNFFSEVSKVLEVGAKLVIILPRIRTREGKIHQIDIKEAIGSCGLELTKIFENNKLTLPLEYSESWHKLERLIYIFENNN